MPEIVAGEIRKYQRLALFLFCLLHFFDVVRKHYSLYSPVDRLRIVNVAESVQENKIGIAIMNLKI